MRLYTPYSLSRGAPSATRSSLRSLILCLKLPPLPREPGLWLPTSAGDAVFGAVQIELPVQCAHGQLHVLLVDHDRGLDFRGRDHLDVDAFVAQALEHAAGHADMAAHADADDADLADAGVAHHVGRAELGHDLALEQVHGLLEIVAVHREAEVGLAVLAQVLDDHIDLDVGLGHRTQDLVRDAWLVGHAEHGDLGFVAVEGNAGNDGLFHLFVFLKSDQGAGGGFFIQVDVPGREARKHTQGHLVLAGKFHRTDLQHLAAHACHFQHLFKAHTQQAARFGHHARVGRVHAVHVGVDQAFGRLQGCGHGHGRGVAAATAERGDVAVRIHALEAGDDDHLAGIQIGAHAQVVDRFDARLGVGAV